MWPVDDVDSRGAVADKNRVWMLYTENAGVRFGCVLSNRNTARDLSVPTLHQLAWQANLEAKQALRDAVKGRDGFELQL